MTLLEQLQELAPLAAAATAGPWVAAGNPNRLQKVCDATLDFEIAEYVAHEDAAFIAQARNVLTPEHIAQLIAALTPAPAVTGWVSVTDGLPENLGRVLVRLVVRGQDQEVFDFIIGAEYLPGGRGDNWTHNTWRTDEAEWYGAANVTHWQPLPTPPTTLNTPDHA